MAWGEYRIELNIGMAGMTPRQKMAIDPGLKGLKRVCAESRTNTVSNPYALTVDRRRPQASGKFSSTVMPLGSVSKI